MPEEERALGRRKPTWKVPEPVSTPSCHPYRVPGYKTPSQVLSRSTSSGSQHAVVCATWFVFSVKGKPFTFPTLWWWLGEWGGGGGGVNGDRRDLTLGGEHTTLYTGDVLKN